MKVHILSAALLAALCTDADAQFDHILADGRALTTAFSDGDSATIWSHMNDEMRQALGSEAALSELERQVDAGFGAELEILSEYAQPANAYLAYMRTARHERGMLVTQWTLDKDGKVAGFFVRPAGEAAPSTHLDYDTRARLALPFHGEWFVYWGGRTPDANYHAVDPGQRFAVDLTVLREGSNHEGDGTRPEDYYCWNQPVLAPANGTVAHATGDLPDQAIGDTDTANPAGNHVVIDLGNDEYVFLAHLQHGSVAVKEGDTVAEGQVLGRCGNSGNTSEPHLHIHLQTSPILGQGEGLPVFFNSYRADGKPVARGELLRGQSITPDN